MEDQQAHYLSTESTQEGFDFWSQQSFVPNELKDSILSASILFIPTIDFREDSGPTFPANTTFLLDYFKELSPDNLLVDIAVSDDEYRELALYNNYVRLGKFLVKEVALPVFINILSGFISDNIVKKDEAQHPIQITYNIQDNSHNEHITQNLPPVTRPVDEHPKAINKKLSPTHRKRSEAHVPKYPTKHIGPSHVEFEITIEDTTGRRKSFRYEGPATEAHKITQDIKTLWENESRAN